MTGTITWVSSAPSIVTVNTTGVVTSVANGTAQITATFASLSASAPVTVQQAVSQLVAVAGDGQAGTVGTVGRALAQALSVQANDQGGNPVEGTGLTFAVAAGGGALTVTSATAGADGRASTAWTLGTTAGPQTVTASATSNAALTTTFTATGQADVPTVLSAVSGDAQSAPRGQSLSAPVVALVADQHGNPVAGQSVAFGVTAGGGSVEPAVAVSGEDGTASTTWTLGPVPGANALTASVTGLSDAGFDQMEAVGSLTKVVIHEMGHVLGIGTLWPTLGLLINPSLPSSPGVDTHFNGPLAIAAFDAAGGTAYVAGQKVPVENLLGPGSGDGHFRESVLKTEAMTPVTGPSASDPLSAISTESLADMGYVVNSAQADPFTLTLPAAAAAEVPAGSIRFENDLLKGPMYVVDRNGRIIRVIRR